MNSSLPNFARQGRKPYTRGEFLIVFAIIIAIIAVFFSLTQIHASAQLQASCLVRQRQFATAISQYVQDYDQTYPWSYSYSEDGQELPVLVLPYLKKMPNSLSAFSCPSGNTHAVSYSVNGQVVGLLDIEHKLPAPGWYSSVIKMSRVKNPREIVLLGDGILSTFIDDLPPARGRRSAGEFAYPHPADVTDHTNDLGWDVDWLGIPNNNHQVSWRHRGGANFIFCDGHAQYAKPGDMHDANWDVRCQYGQICEGSPRSGLYPVPDGSCGNQSSINCQ